MLHDFGRGHLLVWLCTLMLTGLQSAPAQPCAFWEDSTPGPLPRISSAMAYDSARGVTVLFGGSPRFGDTWEWNGVAWSRRATTGPTPRSEHHMVYDSGRGVTVLFGGRVVGDEWLNDTWEWDGQTWTLRATTGPQPRRDGAMAYDSARGVTVLFGGLALRDDLSVTEDNETWEWDGTTWTQRQPLTVPPARSGCSLAYDAGRGVSVLFGGEVYVDGIGDLRLTDTWEWNGTDWTQRTPIGPVPTGSGPMVYDAGRQAVVLNATTDARYASAITWQWNGTAWTPILTGPAGRGQAMAYDSWRSRIVLFGGIADVATSDTWELQYGTWYLVATSGPLGAWSPAMAYDSHRQEAVLFSSYGVGQYPPTETWIYDSAGWQKKYWIVQPPYRLGAAMAFDSDRGVSVLFGGQTIHSETLDETWEWNGNTWSRAAAAGPSPRMFAAVAYDTARKVVVLFGGMARPGNIVNCETWEWDGAAWTLRSTSGPSPRAGHAMAYDIARGVTVLFGGGDEEVMSNETWEWDGSAWTQRSPAIGPSARFLPSMAYDSRRQVTVLFGGAGYEGETYTEFGETWQWDGQEWIRRAVGGPAGRALAAMAYDSDRDRLLLYGGTNSYSQGDTWVGRVPVAGDANGDDAVNVVDLLILVEQFGLTQGDPLFDGCADFDTSGAVDVADLLEIVGRWGWQASGG